MSIPARFRMSSEAKKAGWFSRRHEDGTAHRAEQDRRDKRNKARREREAAAQGAADNPYDDPSVTIPSEVVERVKQQQ